MIHEPTISFLALRLRKGGREQYIANWSLKTILFTLGEFSNDSIHGAGLRINHPRVRKIASQWTSDSAIPMMSPLIVLVGNASSFKDSESFPESGFGILSLALSDLLDICDGVHRVAALKSMDFSNDFLISTEWPVEIIVCKDGSDAAQLIQRMRNEPNANRLRAPQNYEIPPIDED